MGRTLNALEQSPHDPTCGSARAGNHVDYREIILGDSTGTCRPPEDATAPKPVPQDPAGSVGTRPISVNSTVIQPSPTLKSTQAIKPEDK